MRRSICSPAVQASATSRWTRFFGTGVCSRIPKKKWELITAPTWRRQRPAIEADDIVLINTGWHRRYADSKEYFGHAPGLSQEGGRMAGEEEGQARRRRHARRVDHPLATSLGPHRNGPQIKYLLPEYKEATGREAMKDFPDWNVAHKTLLAAGIPTIENRRRRSRRGDRQARTFQGFPWKWHEGDACVIRLVAIFDPKGNYRLESGERRGG